MSEVMRFQDREEAGQRLAERLQEYRDRNPVVLGLPRGGVPVAYEIARALNAPLDVLVARKLGAPEQPELGIGAIAPGDVRVLDDETVDILGLTEDEIARVERMEREEMHRRIRRYRGEQKMPELTGSTAIIVDDGIATGVTVLAAIRAVRKLNPDKIVLAVGACAAGTAEDIAEEVDDFVCIITPVNFRAVGLWFVHFDQTTDEQVIELLRRAREEPQADQFIERKTNRTGRDT